MYLIGELFGAFLVTFLISRALLSVMKTWDAFWRRLSIAHGFTLSISLLLSGMGNADGGAFAPFSGIHIYGNAILVGLFLDVYYFSRHGRILGALPSGGSPKLTTFDFDEKSFEAELANEIFPKEPAAEPGQVDYETTVLQRVGIAFGWIGYLVGLGFVLGGFVVLMLEPDSGFGLIILAMSLPSFGVGAVLRFIFAGDIVPHIVFGLIDRSHS